MDARLDRFWPVEGEYSLASLMTLLKYDNFITVYSAAIWDALMTLNYHGVGNGKCR